MFFFVNRLTKELRVEFLIFVKFVTVGIWTRESRLHFGNDLEFLRPGLALKPTSLTFMHPLHLLLTDISLQLAGAGMHYTECSVISNYLLTFINVHLWSA